MNKVILMGRLTKNPELRYTPINNTPVCSFSLAVNRKTVKDGKQQVDFINIITWYQSAEFCSKYYSKGMKIAVVGRVQTRLWEDNEGHRHNVTEVVADETYFADSKKSGPQDNKPENSDISRDMDGFYPMDDDDSLPL